MSSQKLKFLGVPAYIGSGWHESGGSKYRFMIMERFGEDIDQIFAKCGKQFHIQTVLTLAIRIVSLRCIQFATYLLFYTINPILFTGCYFFY